MSDAKHDLLIKLIAVALGLWAFVWTAQGLEGGGVFWKVFVVLRGLVVLGTAVGFARYRGWAFLLVSVGLLVGFLVTLVQLIVSFDTGADQMDHLVRLLLVIVLIAYLGRWSMERRFRPHLDDH